VKAGQALPAGKPDDLAAYLQLGMLLQQLEREGEARDVVPELMRLTLEIAAKTLFDAEVGYRFNQIDLSIGAKNIFDIYPSRMLNTDNNNNWTFPWAVTSPFGYNGRYLYVRTEMQLSQ